MPWPIGDSSGIISPNSATDGTVIIIEARYSTTSAARFDWVMAMPIGTAVTIAIDTATATIDTCSSARAAITSRLS